MTRIVDLRCKEVVNICDGCRMGFVYDVEIDLVSGTICAIIVPGPCRFFGLFGRGDDYIIPWGSLRRVGDDIILVECPAPERCQRRRERRRF